MGFAFDTKREQVALIQKARPKWQAGKLNGIGGHVEENEAFPVAQQREFWEETGVVIPANNWTAFASLIGLDWHVRCFHAFTDDVFKIRSMTDEPVALYPVKYFHELNMINNLHYLLPLALDDEHVGVPMFHYGVRTKKAGVGASSLEAQLDQLPLSVTTAAK